MVVLPVAVRPSACSLNRTAVVASATFLVDAESNLGTALGGMSDMPGMELSMPPKALDSSATDHSAHGTPAKP